MSYIVGTVEFAAADDNDAIVVTVPPYHIAGISSVLSSTYSCRRLVLLPPFEPQTWLQVMRSESVSHAFLVPDRLRRILAHMVATPYPKSILSGKSESAT